MVGVFFSYLMAEAGNEALGATKGIKAMAMGWWGCDVHDPLETQLSSLV